MINAAEKAVTMSSGSSSAQTDGPVRVSSGSSAKMARLATKRSNRKLPTPRQRMLQPMLTASQ